MTHTTKYAALTLIFVLISTLNHAGTIVVKGKNKTYAGSQIKFYAIDDYFTYSEKTLCIAAVDDSGSFGCSFEFGTTQQVFTDLGIFKAHIYAEPGKTYELVLPNKVEKEIKDKLNPYFQPVEIHLGIIGATKDDVNVMIRMFNDAYVPYFNKHVVNVVLEKDFTKLDQDIENLIKPFSDMPSEYFQAYTQYKLGLLRFLAQQNKSQKSSDDFFDNRPVLYKNQAYMDLFNQVYDRYFNYFGRTEDGKKIYESIGKYRSLEMLNHTLAKNKTLEDSQLREMVILKNLYEEYYKSDFSRLALLTILDSLISESKYPEHISIGHNIREKVTKLTVGFEPPQFQLYNKDSVLIGLDDFKGKYVYLNFCASHSYTCIQEYEALKFLYNKYKDYIEIVTISVDMSFNAMLKSIKQTNCPWTFLHYGHYPEVIEDYDIRTFPTYFLIDKEGRMAISPAPSPGQQIEKSLFELLRSRGDI
jgi:peroxiredoxin